MTILRLERSATVRAHSFLEGGVSHLPPPGENFGDPPRRPPNGLKFFFRPKRVSYGNMKSHKMIFEKDFYFTSIAQKT